MHPEMHKDIDCVMAVSQIFGLQGGGLGGPDGSGFSGGPGGNGGAGSDGGFGESCPLFGYTTWYRGVPIGSREAHLATSKRNPATHPSPTQADDRPKPDNASRRGAPSTPVMIGHFNALSMNCAYPLKHK